jgi:hypothetical protein
MKPFLTPHASARQVRSAPRPTPFPQQSSARSTVLLSLLLAPRNGQDSGGPRNR